MNKKIEIQIETDILENGFPNPLIQKENLLGEKRSLTRLLIVTQKLQCIALLCRFIVLIFSTKFHSGLHNQYNIEIAI